MIKVVVDTNVPVVANGRSEQASPECVRVCVRRLRQITKGDDRLVLDDAWRIIQEYKNNLQSRGQPGVGNAFLKWVLTNRANTKRCELIRITPDNSKGFLEFPADPALSDFDPSDRKFVAVALAHPERPLILQAVDTKWWHFREALQRNDVRVDFICPAEIQR